MTWLDSTVEISFPVLVSALITGLIVLLATGILWAILRYTSILVARYVPILNGVGISLINPLIVVAELSIIASYFGLGAATAQVAFLAFYWCSKLLREIYLLINNQISFTPVSGALMPAVVPAAQQQAPRLSAPPPQPTTTTVNLDLPVSSIVPKATELATRQLPILTRHWGTVSAARPLPQQPLTKRATLGKLTVRAFLE